MGLTLEFYVGNADVLSQAFEDGEIDFDFLSEFSKAGNVADFSLHLEIHDLDILSEVAAKLARNSPIYLQNSVERIIADEADHGAFLISLGWVERFSALPRWGSRELTAQWFQAMSQHHRDSIQVTPDAEHAVESLLRICKQAISNSEDVVLYSFGSSLF
jgi:hypothetical protein